MEKWYFKTFLVVCAAVLIGSVSMALSFRAETGSTGNIIGFIYAKDGTTPMPGAIIKFKNLTSGSILASDKSDANGIFKLQGVESGVYTFGVMTDQGDFNADNIVGIKVSENETAKLSIALQPYSKEEAAAVSELSRDQEPNGETLVAMIDGFDTNSQMAKLQMVKGLLRVNDKIHAKGASTDFYQDIGVLEVGDSPARQILSSQSGSVKLERRAERGDRVFVVRQNKTFPFFLGPMGLAAVIAGNTAVTYGVIKVTDKSEPVSAFKN
jgi:hypothetical protein